MTSGEATICTHSFAFSQLPLKAKQQFARFDCWTPAVESWLATSLENDSQKESGSDPAAAAAHYQRALAQARVQLLGLLQDTTSSIGEVAMAETKYLQLLAELEAVEQQLPEHDTEGSRQVMQSTWSDSILPLAAFTSSKGPSTALNSSRQACAAAASEKDCTVSSASKTSNQQLKGKVQSSMFAFEAANVLLAIASWKLVKAGTIVMSQTGADSAACMEAYQLYCQAAGQLDEIRRKLLPILNTGSTGDLHRGLLSALHFFALGEAQSIMLQRAVALDYQGSTLAPMATDSAMLYSQAFEALEAAVRNLELPWPQLPLLLKPCNNSTPTAAAAAPGASDKNNRMASFERLLAAELPQDWPAVAMPCLHLAAYLQYQLSHTYCLAAICTAELCLASNKAGQAVALAQLGSNLSEQLQDLGFKQAALLDPCSALGVRDSSRRLALQALLEQKAVQVLRRCLRENRSIYLQFVPEHPSSLAWPQRSAQPEIFKLPVPKGILVGATAQSLTTAAGVSSLLSSQGDHAQSPSPAAAQQQTPSPAAECRGPVLISSARSIAGRSYSYKQNCAAEPNSLTLLAEEIASVAARARTAAVDKSASYAYHAQRGSGQDELAEDYLPGVGGGTYMTGGAKHMLSTADGDELDLSGPEGLAPGGPDTDVNAALSSSAVKLLAAGLAEEESCTSGTLPAVLASHRADGTGSKSERGAFQLGAKCSEGAEYCSASLSSCRSSRMSSTDSEQSAGMKGMFAGLFTCCMRSQLVTVYDSDDENEDMYSSEASWRG